MELYPPCLSHFTHEWTKLQLTVEGDKASTGAAAWAKLPDITRLLLCTLSLPCLLSGLLWTTEVCPVNVHVHFAVSLNGDLLLLVTCF